MTRIRIIAPLLYSEIDESVSRVIFDELILVKKNPPDFFNEWEAQSYAFHVGIAGLNVIFHNNFFYFDGTLEEATRLFGGTRIDEIAVYACKIFSSYCNVSTLVKDNSMHVPACYVIKNAFEEVYVDRRVDFFSLAEGAYREVPFSNAEFQAANEWWGKIFEISATPGVEDDDESIPSIPIVPNTASHTVRNEQHFLPYDINRVGRAILMLQQARRESFLPIKIAYYNVLLECIFSVNDSVEINHKVAERAASVVGKDRQEKVDIMGEVKESYSVRSKFLHGQKLTYKKGKKTIAYTDDELKIIADKTDKTARASLIHMITNYELFIGPDETLDKHFREMLFS